MSDDPKLTKDQLVGILKDARAQEIVDEAEAMSDEEVEKQMKESGLTERDQQASLARQRLRFEAVRDAQKASRLRSDEKATKAKEAPSAGKMIEMSAFRARLIQWAAVVAGLGGLTATGSTAAMYMRVAELETRILAMAPTAAAATDGGAPVVHLAIGDELRNDALRMYVLGRYDSCILDLDQARRLDPGPANDDQAIQTIRERSERAIAEQKNKGP
jgi:hypothetical protein